MKLSSFSVLLFSSLGALASPDQKPLSHPISHSPSTSQAPSYRDDLVELHQSLVEISSVSGDENSIAQFLIEYLTDRNFVAQLEFVPPQGKVPSDGGDDEGDQPKPRFNVLAWPGPSRNPSPKVLVTSHIDTVPPFLPYSRSSGELGPETIFAGRGSVDAKASIAAQVTAVFELLRAKAIERDDVMLLFVVDEEKSGTGMRFFSDNLPELQPPPKFKAAIFGEPTEGKLACGHKGSTGGTIIAKGKAGHSGYPWLGKSATEVLVRALVKIQDTDLGSSELFGNTTVNIGLIEGGVAPNVISEHAQATLAFRIAIGPQVGGADIVKGRVEKILKEVDAEALSVEWTYGYGVVKCECNVDGFESFTVNYGTDVPNLKGDHKRYLYGPGTIFVAHGPDEAIKLKDLEEAVEGYKKLIVHALNE